MPLREWTLIDTAGYEKAQAQIDAIITTALLDGPRSCHELMGLLRAAGFGNATNDSILELSYSSTGAIYRSAQNSLRHRGIICDSWDMYDVTRVRGSSTLIYKIADLKAAANATPTQGVANA